MNMTSLLKVLMLFVFFFFPFHAGAEDLGALRLSQIQGDVQVQSGGESEWFPAAVNLPLRAGDRLWVPEEARAQIESREGSVVRLDAESSLEILTVERNALQVYLGSGQAYLNFIKKGEFMCQVDTPVSSFRSYDNSSLNVALDKNGNVDLSVFRGEVFAENRSGEVRVEAGRMLTVDEGTPFFMDLEYPSDWERWNMDQDQAMAENGADEEEYLPPELSVYGRDLRQNGRWISTREYGYVWTPTMHVSVDWAPYRHGRWVWIGNDYVWIGSEPWGWAPYHYGRWSHIPSHGWCWVPPRRNEVYWGPGYVSWIQTTSDVAWVPLAPEEMYYGHGYYGPFSTNIIDIDIYAVIPGRNYRNSRVRDAVTVVRRDAFLSGKYREGRRRDNPFMQEKIHFGRPGLEPQRMTRMPAIKEVPRDKRPPEHVRSMPSRAGERVKPTLRGHDRSVVNPADRTRPVSVPGGEVRSESVRQHGDEPSRPGSFRDRRSGEEHGARQAIPVDSSRIQGEEGSERRRPAPGTEAPGAAVQPQTSQPVPEPSTAIPVREQRVPEEERKTPSRFRERPQSSDQEDGVRSFRGRPSGEREHQGRASQPVQAAPQVSQPVDVPSQPAPSIPEQRSQPEEERKAPSRFRERPQSPDQGDGERSFRGRPSANRDNQERASQPIQAAPQVSQPVDVPTQPAPSIREQRSQLEERTSPSRMRERPQSQDQGDGARSFRERPARTQEHQEQVRPQAPVQPQVAAPPSPAPQQSAPPASEAGKRRHKRADEAQEDEKQEGDDPAQRGVRRMH